jgi:hypothetical protein
MPKNGWKFREFGEVSIALGGGARGKFKGVDLGWLTGVVSGAINQWRCGR